MTDISHARGSLALNWPVRARANIPVGRSRPTPQRGEGLRGAGERALLENRDVFEGPRRLLGRGDAPPRMSGDDFERVGKIVRMIGAKMQRGAGRGERVEGVEQAGLQHAVLPVAALRPWIGEQHKHARQPRRGGAGQVGERAEKQRGLRLHEEEVGEFGAAGLALGALDAVADQVDAHAKLLRMRGRVGVQVVAVAAAELQGERRVDGKARKKRFAQDGETLVADGIVKFERHGAEERSGDVSRRERRLPAGFWGK